MRKEAGLTKRTPMDTKRTPMESTKLLARILVLQDKLQPPQVDGECNQEIEGKKTGTRLCL